MSESLSERVVVLEQALGEARSAYEIAVRFWEHRRHLDRPWWVRIGQKLRR